MVEEKNARQSDASNPEAAFEAIVQAFAADRNVQRGGGQGFGSGALKVNGRIFAMLSSKNRFVVKLAKERVDELVNAGHGERFDPGHGRLMKEWFVVGKEKIDWIDLAKEACEYAKR